jgi:hypothetical protein
MKITKTLQCLSKYLKNPEVLTNPEPFLGPNWETVLRFWLYWESLTREQRIELIRRYGTIDLDTRSRAYDLASNAATEVIGEDNRHAVFMVAPIPTTITVELISMHLLFERGYQLTFVPLIKDL